MILNRLIILVNMIVIVIFIWMGQKQITSNVEGNSPILPLVGYEAPSFQLKSFGGELISYPEDLLGQPVLINFWASWCPPCRAEMPDLVEVSKLYGDQLAFIGINVTSQDGLSQGKQFIEEFAMNYPNLVDKDGSVSRRYQVPPIPTTLVIDAGGTIVYRKMGGMTKTELVTAVKLGLSRGGKDVQ